MAAQVGVEPKDATFRRALKDLEVEGILVAEGSTRDRRYRNARTNGETTEGAQVAEAILTKELLDLLPCTAREFSDGAHRLGLVGSELGRLKIALSIQTYKASDGRWHCRHVEGYNGPLVTARQAAGLTTSNGSTDGDRFAPLASRHAKAVSERKPQKAKAEDG